MHLSYKHTLTLLSLVQRIHINHVHTFCTFHIYAKILLNNMSIRSRPALHASHLSDSCQNVAPASMWTRRDIQDFKESIKREGGDSVIKVGHGETVTVSLLLFYLAYSQCSSPSIPLITSFHSFPFYVWQPAVKCLLLECVVQLGP